jgi:hypothetical protein
VKLATEWGRRSKSRTRTTTRRIALRHRAALEVVGEAPSDPGGARHPRATGDPNYPPRLLRIESRSERRDAPRPAANSSTQSLRDLCDLLCRCSRSPDRPLQPISLCFCASLQLPLDRSFHLRPGPDALRMAPMRTILQFCRRPESRLRKTIPRSVPSKSLDCLLAKRARMLPFRSPNDQLHVLVLRRRSWETAESRCSTCHPDKRCSAPLHP